LARNTKCHPFFEVRNNKGLLYTSRPLWLLSLLSAF
jgi:hypothetical protein